MEKEKSSTQKYLEYVNSWVLECSSIQFSLTLAFSGNGNEAGKPFFLAESRSELIPVKGGEFLMDDFQMQFF